MTDPSAMTDAVLPLITLEDGRAPYKGTWCLVQHAEQDLEAIHTTYHPHHAPGCEIERLNLKGEEPARRFLRHLLLHNWRVRQVHRAGEAFWVALPTSL